MTALLVTTWVMLSAFSRMTASLEVLLAKSLLSARYATPVGSASFKVSRPS